MFIGRSTELDELEERLASNRFEMLPIYGRRRVGKTRLLEEFVKDKRAIFYTADQFGEESNLNNLSQAILSVAAPMMSLNAFGTFEAAFDYVGQYAKSSPMPLVFIIDEFPYLAQSSEGISSVLQRMIDKVYLSIDNLMLILAGSQLSFMEKQVLGYESPLYGRRTGQIKLEPLNYQESHQFLPTMPDEDFMTLFGLTGGIPLYLTMMQDELSLEENIKRNVLRKNTFLYEEPSNLLMQELRTPNRYNNIIATVASGASELKDIIGKTGLESSVAARYLGILTDLNIIEKRTPLTKIGKNKSIYRVSDGLFSFWYRYVPRYRNFIETSRIDLVWEKIAEDLPKYTSYIFEDFCRSWVIRNKRQDFIPFLIAQVGSWWGNNPLTHDKSASSEEVDVIGIGVGNEDLLIGECKWYKNPLGRDIGEKLVERSKFFPYLNKKLCIFSKSDFSLPLIEYAEKHEIALISLENMLE